MLRLVDGLKSLSAGGHLAAGSAPGQVLISTGYSWRKASLAALPQQQSELVTSYPPLQSKASGSRHLALRTRPPPFQPFLFHLSPRPRTSGRVSHFSTKYLLCIPSSSNVQFRILPFLPAAVQLKDWLPCNRARVSRNLAPSSSTPTILCIRRRSFQFLQLDHITSGLMPV